MPGSVDATRFVVVPRGDNAVVPVSSPPLSLVVRGGTVYDGTGSPGARRDVLVADDRIVGIGTAPHEHDAQVIDATGLAVTPGFVNVLSHAWPAMLVDGGAESEIRQGVTTEVFGEADSPGPADAAYGEYQRGAYESPRPLTFTRLGDGLDALEAGGVAANVASFVGGGNLRHLGAGFDDRPLTRAESDRMCGVLADELADGALGVGTALIYPPGRYADTAELTAVCEVLAAHDALYVSHLRSEADGFLDALDELIGLHRTTGVRAEVYHLKAAGRRNWPKMTTAIERIAAVRAADGDVGANMYPYEAGGNHLGACVPPRFAAGGPDALAARLADAAGRAEIASALRAGDEDFEDLFHLAGAGAGVLLLRDLRDGTPAQGHTVAAVATALGLDDVDGLLEIIARDPWMPAAFFFVDPANLELGLSQPWVSIGSDASAHAAAPPWSERATHPRTYGTFARILGHYARERGVVAFTEAVRRMTSLPADRLRLAGRGRIAPGSFADLVVLDPAVVADIATWEDPHRYAVGVNDVVVNGRTVLRDGVVTGARPGRRLRRGR